MMLQAMGEPLRVLVVSKRPAVHLLFEHLGERDAGVRIARVRDLEAAVGDAPVERTVGVVDLALEPGAVKRQCEAVHRRRPALPLLAVMCCRRCVTAAEFRELFTVGVRGVVDLFTSEGQMLDALREVYSGGTALQLHLRATLEDGWQQGVMREGTGLPPGVGEQLPLLQLVARGLSNEEIAAALQLSDRAVHHRIAHLCQRIGLRNRTELAAWAGRAGLYHRPSGGDRAEPLASGPKPRAIRPRPGQIGPERATTTVNSVLSAPEATP